MPRPELTGWWHGAWVGVWVRRGALLLVTVLLVEHVVLPQLLGARAALDPLTRVDPRTLLVALALEPCSLLSCSALTRAVLGPAHRPPYGVLLRTDLTGLGASHVVPGGGATAAALRYRRLTHAGVAKRDAVTSTAIQTGLGVVAGILVPIPVSWSTCLSMRVGVFRDRHLTAAMTAPPVAAR